MNKATFPLSIARFPLSPSHVHTTMATVSTATATSPDGPATATAAYSGPPRGNGTEKEAGVKRKVAGWRHFVAGGVGGMTGAIVTSPFDVVKVSPQSGAGFRAEARKKVFSRAERGIISERSESSVPGGKGRIKGETK